MDPFKYQQLVAAAFRIYLTHTLHETEDLLRGCKIRWEICTSASDRSDWENAQVAGRKVIAYIKITQSDDANHGFSVYGCHGLCAIEAAQDALACSLCANEHSISSTHARFRHLANLSDYHLFRARCIVNEIVALTRQDLELAALCEQAAQHIYRISNLKRPDNAKYVTHSTGNGFFSNATYLDVPINSAVVNQQTELRRLAARNSRMRGVYFVLDRITSHGFAADTFQTASEYAVKAAHCSSSTSKLWNSAVSTMRLAAEMIEAQALNRTAENDVAIRDTIAQAKAFARDTEDVVAHLAELERLKTECASTNARSAQCKHPSVLPVWRALAQSQEKAHHNLESYIERLLEGEARTLFALRLTETINENKIELAAVTKAANQLEQSIRTLNFYKSHAAARVSSHHPDVRKMDSDCWDHAANHMNEAVHLLVQCINEQGEFQPLAPAIQCSYHLHKIKATMYAACADEYVTAAVRYLNCANGARDALRDPREERLWRAAADCLVRAVTQRCADLKLSLDNIPLTAIALPMTAHITELLNEADMLATAADYHYRSFQFRTQPDQPPYAARVAELYTFVAVMSINKDETVAAKTISWCLEYIDCLTGMKRKPTDLALLILERGCEYAERLHECIDGEYNSLAVATQWQHALNACITAQAYHVRAQHDWSRRSMDRATLHARSAIALGQGDARNSCVYSYVAEVLEDARASGPGSPALVDYCTELARRLSALAEDDSLVPIDQQQWISLEINPQVESFLGKQVAAYECMISCSMQDALMRSPCRAGKALYKAKEKAEILVRTYMSEVWQHYNIMRRSAHAQNEITARIALQEASLKCYMAAARSKLPMWETVMQICHDAARAKDYIAWENAVPAIERYMLLAEALDQKDQELTSLRREPAQAARQMFSSKQYASSENQIDAYKLKAADHRVEALLARRSGRNKLSYVHLQIAKLSQELMESYHSQNLNSKKRDHAWKSLSVQQALRVQRTAAFDKIKALDAKAAVLASEPPDIDPPEPAEPPASLPGTPATASTPTVTPPPEVSISSSLRASAAARRLAASKGLIV